MTAQTFLQVLAGKKVGISLADICIILPGARMCRST